MQANSNDIVVGFDLIASLIDVISNARVNIDFLFGEWYKHTLEPAQKVSVKPRVCSKQRDREKHYIISTTDYYKVSLAILLSELEKDLRRTKPLFLVVCILFYGIMASSPNWRDYFNDF